MQQLILVIGNAIWWVIEQNSDDLVNIDPTKQENEVEKLQ